MLGACANPTPDWHRRLAVNLAVCFLMCRAVLSNMVRADGGVIINMSSAAALALVTDRGAYITSNAACLL
ncbi:SDR family NAD(P)-dependent oxidoreductase [Alicyclobacillus macrosporangiidus]|uniref:SDR family NAD(P)-dependent oxidoreductase n=1 Tax=Alicyclobacillus macrosporangiidus TaxID=392015 RepID=UPI0009DD7AA6